jgi:hypothetical protein
MAVPYGRRFAIEFDELFPQGAVMIGEITPDNEYQSKEDKAKGRPIKQRIDEETGERLWKVTVTDPSATRDGDKSVTVQMTAPHQPVPPEGVEIAPGVKVRLVVFEGVTVQPKLEGNGEFKRIGYIVRARGMRGVQTRATGRTSVPAEQKPAA